MKTIVMLGQKGGSGKTTLAINLAVAADMQGECVALLDADPQKSTMQWFKARQDNGIDKDKPALQRLRATAVLPSQIDIEILRAKRAGSTLCIVDTAPHMTPAATRIAEHADLAIIPCRPTALDLGTMATTSNILKAAKVRELLVLTACNHRCNETEATRHSLHAYGLNVCPVRLGERIAFSRSVASGRSVLDLDDRRLAQAASDEVLVLWSHIEGVLSAEKKSGHQKSARHG